MASKKKQSVISVERIAEKILIVRDERVLLDSDLARLYGVETRTLNQTVTRNLDRFPIDFMFELTWEEFQNLKSQIVTSSWGGRRKPPRVFTEQGVAMLSSVLQSKRAIQVNIVIMRTFIRLRQLINSHETLARKLAKLEQTYDARFKVVFEAIRNLMTPKIPERRRIGFDRK